MRYLCFDMYEITTTNYLFVYGTLLDEGNAFGTYLKKNCSFYADGKFRGRLYDIGEYPGAVADDKGGYVYGRIYTMNNEDVLVHLDDYEGFGDGQKQPNLFVRKIIGVENAHGLMDCQVYLYNLAVDGLRVIESGDYKKLK